MNDDINDRLRVTGEEYEPDRDRMWARVADGMREPRVQAEPVRTGWRIPQLGLATGAALALIGAIVFFGQVLGLGPVIGPSPEPPPAGPGTRSEEATDPRTSADATTDAAETPTSEAEEGEETETAETAEEGSSPEAENAPEWLWTDGSVDANSGDFWSQANLFLKNEEPLAAVTIELRVAQGDSVEHTGSWTTADSYFTAAAVTEEDGFLVYRWTLQEGKVLPAGEYQLAGQFNHGSGPRSADEDRYSFTAETEGGEAGEVAGDFE
ncbi:hypothetical protein AB0K52_19840 [Glycomyces sp. NPDC049804]|uniref:hypothetical protein n=1 Tax=Glycomyces sp. NPDC049804 TaxID=3154363 RepID=UPI00344657D8